MPQPVKLSDALIDSARKVAAGAHRSLASQVEHWAALGRAVEGSLTVEQAAALKRGVRDAPGIYQPVSQPAPSPGVHSRPAMTAEQWSRMGSACRRFGVRRMALFGSATGADFNPASSDVDVAVTFLQPPDAATATDYFLLKQELESVFGRTVDLVELDGMSDTRLKRRIERTLVPVYVSEAA